MDLHARNADVVVDTPMPPPRWALLERLLIDAETAATQEFYDRYFDERGYLECYPRWGGDDGPDDAAENFAHWTELYALGAPKVILDLYRKAWEGHLRQYTEAKTTHVPIRPRRYVLPRVPRHVRLGPQRRGLRRLLAGGPH